MHDEDREWDQTEEKIRRLIDQIEGLECLKVWFHPVHNRYKLVVMTDWTDLKLAIELIRIVLLKVMNIEIEEDDIYFARTRMQIERLRARVRLIDCKVEDGGDRCRIEVTLGHIDDWATGYAEGTLDKDEKLRIASEATRKALMILVIGKGKIAIKDVWRTIAKGQEIIVSLISFVLKGERIHCGAALNRADDCKAAIRATLDAINRYLDLMLGE